MRNGYANARKRPRRSLPSSRPGSKAGHLDASNNDAERCMRTVAVGQKAFPFVGSERAGSAILE